MQNIGQAGRSNKKQADSTQTTQKLREQTPKKTKPITDKYGTRNTGRNTDETPVPNANNLTTERGKTHGVNTGETNELNTGDTENWCEKNPQRQKTKQNMTHET